ncbi:subtype I-B CRISPR-associated endonuclease Cas1 [candidate division KSB1 bacterium]|nr:MAG: subtype I-B CRISPR-associated endonuclease Cas1 [candidate division KSB1 bacterium]
MQRNYYIFSNGRLRRRQNTIYFEPVEGGEQREESGEEEAESRQLEAKRLDTEQEVPSENKETLEAGKQMPRKPIPVEDVEAFYVFGEVDFNTKLLNFLAQKKISVHIFNYYGFYSGSYYPREYLNSGFLLVKQVQTYLDPQKRIALAREIVKTGIDNILRNLKYYQARRSSSTLQKLIKTIEEHLAAVGRVDTVSELMGIEGRVRERYYESFNEILSLEEPFVKRVRRPPDNMLNALISFGNSLLYATTLGEIYRTQLSPTISFLHEPGDRRFSLALDISEVFKPLLVDRLIFKVLNTKMLGTDDFDKDLNYGYLKEKGRKVFVQEYDQRLKTTISHRNLGRKVSYRRLIRLECYKLIKHLMGVQEYRGFRAWW